MILGLVGTAVGLFLVGVSETLWLLLVGLAVMSLASGLVFATTTALISLSAREDEQGVVLGVAASVTGLARIAAPLAGAFLFQHVDVSAPMVLGAVLFALCAVGAAWAVGRRPAVAPTP